MAADFDFDFIARNVQVGNNSKFRQGHNYYGPVTLNNGGTEGSVQFKLPSSNCANTCT
jgi:hypothetical protein